MKMRLFVRFRRAVDEAGLRLGPFQKVQILGDVLLASKENFFAQIAECHGGTWWVNGQSFPIVSTEPTAQLLPEYALVKQSTDSREPRTEVTFTSDVKVALNFAESGGYSTYDDPVVAKNYHHTLHTVYLIPEGFELPNASVLSTMAAHASSRDYPKTAEDMKLRLIAEYCSQIDKTTLKQL